MNGKNNASSGDSGPSRDKSSIIILIISTSLVILILSGILFYRDELFVITDKIRDWITFNLNWYYVFFSLLCVCSCIYLHFGRYKDIRIGGKNARPKYTDFSWYSMLFACGQGVGLIFWCVSEPILLSQNNNGLTISDNPAVNALGVSYFHWAINAWSIYCILALALAFLHFNTKKPLSVHSAFISDINQTGRFSIPTVVQVFTIIATVFGLVTSFGFAASQTGSGLNYIFSMLAIDSDIVELGVVGVIFIITCFSLARGVSRGMRRVSELNSILSIFILVCFILFGPLNYILNIFLESVGVYISGFVTSNFWTDGDQFLSQSTEWEQSWNGIWTIFIWSWCISFSPFVATFIAGISYGRTIKQFIFGVVMIPSLIVILWIGIIGGAALSYDINSGGVIYDAAVMDPANGIFSMIGLMPGTVLPLLLFSLTSILIVTYYVTSLNSGIHAISNFIFSSEHKLILKVELLYAMLISLTTISLIIIGGEALLSLIQTGVIICSLPFSMIFIAVVVIFIKKLRQTYHKQDHSISKS